MPFTSQEDSLILKFFHPDKQGNNKICDEFNNLVHLKGIETWENPNI